jgi:hypothetical protein
VQASLHHPSAGVRLCTVQMRRAWQCAAVLCLALAAGAVQGEPPLLPLYPLNHLLHVQ